MKLYIAYLIFIACIVLLALILAASGTAFAGACGYPPKPPPGMVYVCVCDRTASVCEWVLVSK